MGRDNRTREDLRVELVAKQAIIDGMQARLDEVDGLNRRQGSHIHDLRTEVDNLRGAVHHLELELAHTRGRMLADFGDRPPVILKSTNDSTSEVLPGADFATPLPHPGGRFSSSVDTAYSAFDRNGQRHAP